MDANILLNFYHYFIFTFCLITYILAFAIFKKKGQLENYFILLLSFTLLMVFINTIGWNFNGKLFPETDLSEFILNLLSRLSGVGMFFSVTLFMHKLVNRAQSRKAHIIFFSITGIFSLWIIIQSIFYYPDGPAFNIPDILMRCSTLYPVLIYIIYAKNIENIALKKVVRSIFITVACFLPIIILDEFNLVIRIMPDFGTPLEIELTRTVLPLLYLIINLLYIYYGFKYYIKKSTATGQSTLISEQFLSNYKISQREKDIIELLIQGYNNKKISEKLFISPITVRNHIYNIFNKTGVSNRVELIRECTK